MFRTAFTQCAALGAIFSFAAIAAHAQSVPRTDWKVGDTWTLGVTVNGGIAGTSRSEDVRVVKEVSESGYQVESTKRDGSGAAPVVEMLNLSRDHNLISLTGSGGAPQEFKWLQWPLEMGRSYQFETSFQDQVQTWKGKATGWEDVEVPAGKFKALHLEFERNGSNRSAATESFWYAPEAKLVVKRIQSRPGAQRSRDITTFELVKYKFN